MARGEGGEQFSATSLLQGKAAATDGVKLAQKHDQKRHLSVCSKLCFAIGGAPYQITGSALGFFLQIYLLDVAQLDPFYASIILFVGRAWDAVTDPTIGFLVSRSPWTRYGRMLPWIVFSTPFAVLSYFLVWFVPPIDQGKVIWYLIFYCFFQTMQTCFHVPYSALTMFISADQKERDSATAYRMTVEVLGTLIGTAIQGQIVGGAIAPCISLQEINATQAPLTVDLNVSKSFITLDQTKNAYMTASGVICGIYVLCAIILFSGVKEQREISRLKTEKPMLFFQGLRLVMSHGPYVKLVMGFLFTSLAFMLLEGNFALFCSYTLGFRNNFQNILLVIMISATLMIPFWQWFLTKFGKKTAVYIGTTSVIPFMIVLVCMKSNLIVTFVVTFAAGASVAAAFLLPWSMLPDVIDDFQVKNPEARGHEAIFYSFYVFFTKFASGVSLGISTLSLDFAGYMTNGCSQPDAVHLTLRMLVSAAPIALIILGLIIFILYPINETVRQDNRKLLKDLRESEQDSEMDSSDSGNVV
ncbi:sodium-dependent lysophosphatidylcholine symporter 1 [Arapaima gigas]